MIKNGWDYETMCVQMRLYLDMHRENERGNRRFWHDAILSFLPIMRLVKRAKKP